MTATLKTAAQTDRDPNGRPEPAPGSDGPTGLQTRLGVVLKFLSAGSFLPGVAASRRATAFRRVVAAGRPPSEVAAALDMPLAPL